MVRLAGRMGWLTFLGALLVLPPAARGATGGTAPAADPGRLRRDVELLCVEYAPRDSRHYDNLETAAGHIRAEMEKAGGRVEEQRFFADARERRNLRAFFGPRKGERIVVGAHYDAAFLTPGADDNASGVAVLLELARLLGRSPPRRTVELVAWTLEEPPFFGTGDMGSAVHAAELAKARSRVAGVISLEMVGYFRDQPGSQVIPEGISLPPLPPIPDRGDFIAVAGREADAPFINTLVEGMKGEKGLPVVALPLPESGVRIQLSDHRNYWPHGFPAVMVTDTSYLRNPNYHQASDLPDTLDYRRMALLAQALHRALTWGQPSLH